MYSFAIQTLVDITDNGNLKQAFPFKSKSGYLIHDAYSLEIARNQNSNFNTLIQLLQVRGNITFDKPIVQTEIVLNQDRLFGTHYEGRANYWTFVWETEQADVYRSEDDAVGQLISDFDNIPILMFCKETVTFPSSAFLTQDPKFKNTQFTYLGEQTK